MVGALLWLLRKRGAVWVFGVSLVALLSTKFYNVVLSNGLEVFKTTASHVFTAVIFLIAVALLIYARSMQHRGLLV